MTEFETCTSSGEEKQDGEKAGQREMTLTEALVKNIATVS
jgi:hypothetical protein